MTRRKAAQEPLALEQPVGGTCEVCGEEAPRLSNRHGDRGLACCFRCVLLDSKELAVVYLRRLRRASEE